MASDSGQQSPLQKRSYEEMNEDYKVENDTASLVADEVDQIASQGSSIARAVNTLNLNSQPSSTNAGSMAPPSLKPSRSREGSQNSEHSYDGNVTKYQEPMDANPSNSMDDETSNDGDHMEPHVLDEPSDLIEDFDWSDLQQRYHEKIEELGGVERDILNEFEGLCNYFSIWAQSGSSREVDRSFKRMKTQMTLVRHLEDELEKKRQHYIKVVEAFKSALELLAG